MLLKLTALGALVRLSNHLSYTGGPNQNRLLCIDQFGAFRFGDVSALLQTTAGCPTTANFNNTVLGALSNRGTIQVNSNTRSTRVGSVMIAGPRSGLTFDVGQGLGGLHCVKLTLVNSSRTLCESDVSQFRKTNQKLDTLHVDNKWVKWVIFFVQVTYSSLVLILIGTQICEKVCDLLSS